MTREEQRAKAAHEYIQSDSVPAGNETLAFGDFIEGAKWADSHPKWIPVEEELPENIGGFSDEVFICTKNKRHELAMYNYISNCWWSQYSDDEITHWMPMPQPPRKEV